MLCLLGLAGCGGAGQAPEQVRPSDQPQALALLSHFDEWRGVEYRYGGNGRAGLDCSAFIQLTYANVFGRTLPRTTADQVKLGVAVAKEHLRPGDLVFFKTGLRDRHAGIYVGGGDFIHASSSRGVTRSRLATAYWQRHWWTARRLPR